MLLLKSTSESLQITTGPTQPSTFQFPSDLAPSVGSSYNDASSLNLGFIFAVTQVSTATGIRYYSPAAGLSVTPTLYDDTSGSVLATGNPFVTSGTGWVFLPFTSAYTLATGVTYTASILLPSGQYYAATAGGWPYNDGVTYNTISISGRYTYGGATKPVNTTSARYGLDIVIQAIASPTTFPTRKGYTYINNIVGNTFTISPDSTISTGDWMILVYTSYSGAGAVTNPPGWTVLQSSTTVGSLVTAIYAKNRVAGETSYNVTVAANGNSDSVTLMWGSGAAPIASWIIGSNMARASITPTTNNSNVAPSITTTSTNNLVLAISTERTSASESGILGMTGATAWGYTPQYLAAVIQTVSVGFINKPDIGASGDVTVTYPNTQSNNGMALQIGIPPGTGSLSYSASYTDSTSSGATKSSSEGIISSATTTTIVPAPASSTTRLTKMISVVNTDPYLPMTTVFQKNISGTLYNLTPSISLGSGEMIQYVDKAGWTYYAADGTIKTDLAVPSSVATKIQTNTAGKLTSSIAAVNNPTWTQLTASGSHPWNYDTITISSDGSHIFVGTFDDYLYDSTNGGSVWSQQTAEGSRRWVGITGSTDGTKYAAIVNNDYVQTSTDGGNTWTAQTNSGSMTWKSIAGSADGTKLVIAAAGYAYLFTSTDSGVTWTQQTNSNSPVNHQALACSADGTIIADTRYNNYIFISTDSGVTWNQSGSPQQNWLDIAMSANGTTMASVVDGGGLYVSYDSGNTWTQSTSAGTRAWEVIAMSADGTRMLAGADDYVYISNDSGATWTAQTSIGSGAWTNIAITPDGSKAVASQGSGYIYNFSTNPTSPGLDWTTAYNPSKSHALSFSTTDAKITLASNSVVFDSSANIGTANASSWSHTCTGKNLMLIVTLTYGAFSVNSVTTTVTYNGVALTKLGRQNSANTDEGFVELWYLQNPATGTHSVAWTSSGTGATVLGASASFANVGGIESLTIGYTTTTTNASLTVPSATSRSMVVMGAATGSGFTDGNGVQVALINANTGSGAGNMRMSYSQGNNGSVFMANNFISDDSASIAIQLFPDSDIPAPASSTLSLYPRTTAGYSFPSIIDASNTPTSAQSSFAQSNALTWTPGPTNVGTWTGTNGVNVGSAANMLPSTTNTYTAMRRSTFSSVVTTTNQQVGIRSDNTIILGNMARQGGFFFSCRFGFDTIATGMRAFIGLCTGTAIVSSDPSSLGNSQSMLGFGFDLADSSWSFYHNIQNTAVTKEPISGGPTLATNNTGYDAYIWSPPNSGVIYYRLDRTDTGATMVDGSVTKNIPALSTALMATAQMSNGTANVTAAAAVLGINRLYVETTRS